jgi:thiamine-monophosphate kinase
MPEDCPNLDVPICTLGEQQLLQHLQRFCPAHLIGDDAAVLPTRADRHLVITADMLVDGIHFSIGFANSTCTTSPTDVGWRAAAANLSDLAAMGAEPIGITISLGLPPEIPVRWLDELYQGITECLHPYQTPILGGDLCRSPILTLAITALGEVLPNQKILRSTAQPGDAIVVTGIHGASRGGLELLLNPEWGQDLDEPVRDSLKRAHQHPIPRLDIPPLLRKIDPTGRVAGMDSSDGLADAPSGKIVYPAPKHLDRRNPFPQQTPWTGCSTVEKILSWCCACQRRSPFNCSLISKKLQSSAILQRSKPSSSNPPTVPSPTRYSS